MSDTETRLWDGLYIFGTEFGIRFSTEVIETASGAVFRNANWGSALGSGNLGDRVVDQAELNDIIKFFRARKGRRGRFRVRDQGDFNVSLTEGIMTPTQGVGGPTFQCYKRYDNGGTFEDRKLTKLAGTFVGQRAGVTMTVGAGAGQYAIDMNTGILTMVADVTRTNTAHTVGASHVLTASSALTGITTGESIWVTGVSGTLGTALNNKAHVTTNVAGAVYTLAINTTGLSGSGGSCFAYPQSSEAMTFSSEFDVPAHFAVDEIKYRFDAVSFDKTQRLFYLESIPIIEDR